MTAAPPTRPEIAFPPGNIVSGYRLDRDLRRTIAQSAGAIMWSVRMIGVAIAFLTPWIIVLIAVI